MATETTPAAPTRLAIKDAELCGMDWIDGRDFTFTGEVAAVQGYRLATRRINGSTIAVCGRPGQYRFVA